MSRILGNSGVDSTFSCDVRQTLRRALFKCKSVELSEKRMVEAGAAINYGWLNPYIVVSSLTWLPEQYFCIKITITTLPSLGKPKMAARNIL